MPKLSQGQIEMYAQSAGLSADRARIAAAIAMAESSGGDTQAHNAVPPDDSYGLWQINMLGAMGPERRRKLGISSNAALYDPATNARAMAMISNKGANFSPWSTYSKPPYPYKEFLGGAGDATGAGFNWSDPFGTNPFDDGSAPLLGGITDTLKGVNAIAELSVGAAAWIANPHNWVRVAQTGVGALLVGIGLAMMTRGTWQPAVNTAKKVAAVTPVGRGASVAAAATKPKAA